MTLSQLESIIKAESNKSNENESVESNVNRIKSDESNDPVILNVL